VLHGYRPSRIVQCAAASCWRTKRQAAQTPYAARRSARPTFNGEACHRKCRRKKAGQWAATRPAFTSIEGNYDPASLHRQTLFRGVTMPAPIPCLLGQRFGRLTINGGPFVINKKRHWKSVCDCGQESANRQEVLLRGDAISCGCHRRETTKSLHEVHGRRRTPEYKVWAGLRDRCENPNAISFARYGGRGIKVCAAWSSFETFFAHMGPRPSAKHSLDRINNDGDYEPGNCRWATQTQQCRNQSTNVRYETPFGLLTAAEMSEHSVCVVKISALRYRLKKGWDALRAMQTPLMKNQYSEGAA